MQSIVEHDPIVLTGEQRQVLLTAEDVDRVAAEIAAIGAIPALQEGFAVFNEELVGVGWHPSACSFSIGPILVPVPKPGASLDERRALVTEGIECYWGELEDWSQDASQHPADVQEWNRQLQLLRRGGLLGEEGNG
jgi:hypothetical protein